MFLSSISGNKNELRKRIKLATIDQKSTKLIFNSDLIRRNYLGQSARTNLIITYEHQHIATIADIVHLN